jgi:dephospho-CoA kinase
MSMPLRVGLTGGLGSGKTTVAKIFEMLGIPVYYADEEAKKILTRNSRLKQKIIEHFGNESYTGNELNRPFLASIVFNNKEKLDLLNSLVHPITIEDGIHWMKKQRTPFAIKEAALIFEGGVASYLDYVIGVYAPLPLRIQRAMKRDNLTREQVLARMNKQMDENIKMRLCDFIIFNDGQQLVIPQVIQLNQKLLELSMK